jgi:NAD(P)-dependent dehydrogenase (short-subunit alcohol dehydrogenase family)
VNLKGRNVRVHILGPGAIDTDILEGMPREKLDSFVVLLPRGRRGAARRVRLGRALFSSSDSTFVTGIELFVDGGVAKRRKRGAWTALHLFPQARRVQSEHSL